MKEQLYTIPLMDAFRVDDECPFCYIERNLEQHALDFVLGPEASYMQDDIRFETDKVGFCREHLHKMFTYGNPLGSALILETHLKTKSKELKEEMKNYSSNVKTSFMDRFRKDASSSKDGNNVSRWIHTEESSCYVCNYIKKEYDRYMATFFVLFKRNEPDFIDLVKSGKGFCIHHFAEILDAAPLYLNEKEQKELRDILFPQMEENLERILEEIDWFQKKFDYRYRDADWKTSKMQYKERCRKL